MQIRAGLLAATLFLSPSGVFAQAESPYGELETAYLFGFTSGADIGAEGEKEVFAETKVDFGKRNGRYAAFENRIGFETTLSQFVQVEMGLVGASYSIHNVPGVDDRTGTHFRGLFGEFKYLLVEKTPNSPFGLTISFEPVWARLEDSTAERVTQFEFETKLRADYEIVPNTVFAAANLIYEPEIIRDVGQTGWEREAKFGITGAVAGRLTSSVVAGAELGYYRKYGQGLAFNQFEGDALYLGPTLYVQFTKKLFLSAAYSTQIAGHSTDNPGKSLDLDNFARHRAKLKIGFEF